MPEKPKAVSADEMLEAINRFLASPPEGTPDAIVQAFGLLGKARGILPPRVLLETVEQAPVAISVTDPRATILYANSAFEALTGYAREEVIGRNESVLSSKSTPKSVYQDLWQTIQARKVWKGTLVNHRKNGEEYLAELTVSPVLDEAGEIGYYLGMHRDITDIHALQQRLHFHKALNESALDAAPMVVVLIDPEGRVLLDNQAYKALKVASGSEPVSLFLEALADQQDIDARRLLTRGESFTNREIRLDIGQGGGARWFSCSGVPVTQLDEAARSYFQPAHQDEPSILLIANEITESRQRLYEARLNLIRANMAEHQMVQTMREAISAAIFKMQAPVNILRAALSMAPAGMDSVGLVPVLRQALESGEEAIESLHNALPGTHLEAPRSLNLNELVQEVLSLGTDELLAAGVVVDWRAAPVLPALQGRPNALRAMLKYLLDNAIQAVREGGGNYREIRVETRQEDGELVVAVMDNGPGLPPAQALKVFEPFYCGWNDPRGHAGMGLTLAQEAALAHGGGIEIDPDFVGGCRLFVRLPLHSPEVHPHDSP